MYRVNSDQNYLLAWAQQQTSKFKSQIQNKQKEVRLYTMGSKIYGTHHLK